MTSWTTDPQPPVRQIGPGWTTTPVEPGREEESPWFTRFTRVGAMTADGNLAASVEPFIQGQALLRGDGALTAVMAGRHWRTGDVVSNGVLVGEVWSIRTRTADFNGDGLLELGVNDGLSAVVSPGHGAKLEGRGDLTFVITGGNRIYPDGLSADVEQVTGVSFRDMTLSSIGYFGATLAQRVFRGVLHGAEGTLAASVLKVTDAQLSGGGALSATAEVAFTPIIEENVPRTNYPVPVGTSGYWLTMIGGGGGGGGGVRQTINNGVNAGGGGGGGGGGFHPRTFYPISSLEGQTTYSVTIGARGAGAGASNTVGTTGIVGTAGGASIFSWPGVGNNHIANGGGGGGAGTTTTSAVGAGGTVVNATGVAGTAGGAGRYNAVGSNGVNSGASDSGAAGGGGGGGENQAGTATTVGGNGGSANGVAGSGAGAIGPILGQAGPGAGGGDGGGFSGGNNLTYGGGAGGSGGSVGSAAAAAGTGGPGYVKVEWV